MPTINEMIDFCEDFASYDCFSNEQFARREMFYAISDELQKSLREQKRPHGEWIEKPSYKEDRELGIDNQVVCSRCDEQNSHYVYGKDGQIEGKMFIRSNFCPNCGADMRKKEGNNE